MQDTIPQQSTGAILQRRTATNRPQQRTYILMEPIRSGLGHLRAHFLLHGNPKCHGVRATVDEDSSAVLITLYEGTLPNAPTECAAIAVNASLLLTTRNPIGTRSVIHRINGPDLWN